MDDLKPKVRTIKVLLRILGQPYRFSLRDLSREYGVHSDTIKNDILAIKSAGLDYNENGFPYYQYAIFPSEDFKQLKYLQYLDEDDKRLIGQLLDDYSGKRGIYIKRKLESLYDFQQLGLRALRRPVLERLDRLEGALKNKQRVILKNYRSNSNIISDRLVEVFHIDAAMDTIQGFDVTKMKNRHFRLARIERVEVQKEKWVYRGQHRKHPTDIFRIADGKQEMVNLQLDLYAYNLLIEQYPKALLYILPGSEENTFDLACRINHKFLGLRNFIMSNWDHVKILKPDSLRDSIIADTEAFLKKLQKSKEVG